MSGCASLVLCPVCAEPLRPEGRALHCPGGHAYDRARAGYVHLMPAGHGRSGITGDSREMLEARRRFLERGHHAPLATALEAAVRRAAAAWAGSGSPLDHAPHHAGPAPHPAGPVVVDVGCGEGHYLARVAAVLAPPPGAAAPCLFGVDVSRAAARMAARACPGATILVNDVAHRICLASGAADVVMNVFAPRNPAELARVARPGGHLFVVVPEPSHLAELRTAAPLLAIDADKAGRVTEALSPAFALEDRSAITFTMALDATDVADVLRMTPNRHHLDDAAIRRAAATAPPDVTASVSLLSLRRAGRLSSAR